jgi:acyl-CoA thioester hydrolase
MEVDFLMPVIGDQAISISSFVREFQGPDAHIECTMNDERGTPLSRCLMVVACVDKRTNRAMDWPPDARALFFEQE